MKKLFIVLCSTALFFSCGSGGEKKEGTTPAKEESKATTTTNPVEDKALEIVAQSDCVTCHKINETSTGPAWKDVSKKYENTDANVKMLAEKIIKGGSGNWGSVPMTAHPALKEEDAETVVKYILSLKNQ